jgi:hypothetical protein
MPTRGTVSQSSNSLGIREFVRRLGCRRLHSARASCNSIRFFFWLAFKELSHSRGSYQVQIGERASAIYGYRPVRFLRFREYRMTSRLDLTATTRYPSSLTSYAHLGPSGSFETRAHSIGSMKSAFLFGRSPRLVSRRVSARGYQSPRSLSASILLCYNRVVVRISESGTDPTLVNPF